MVKVLIASAGPSGSLDALLMMGSSSLGVSGEDDGGSDGRSGVGDAVTIGLIMMVVSMGSKTRRVKKDMTGGEHGEGFDMIFFV